MSSESPQAPLPDFLIIGAQKSGTSWLAHMLRQHSEVYMPPGEVHYFDKSYNYQKGSEWYRNHFVEAQEQHTIGEKTPDYIWANGDGVEGHLPEVHQNIHDLLPDAKLIVSLRNPVDRAISAVKHIIRSGRISPRHSLDDLLVGDKHHLVEGHGVIEYGHYHQHLTSYLSLFDQSQLLVLFFEEDIVQAPKRGLGKVCQFLGISRPEFGSLPLNEEINADRGTLIELYTRFYAPRLLGIARRLRSLFPRQIPSPSRDTIDTLYDHYQEKNQRLTELIEREIPDSWHSQQTTAATSS